MAFLFLLILSGILVYIYVGYPCLLAVMACLFRRVHRIDEKAQPSITLIISAYNEERVIGAKLENSLALDYPREKLEIIVVSDCSTDQTDSIVGCHAGRGVKLFRTPDRRGKTAGLNLVMPGVTSEIVVFSDANAMYDSGALAKLARHFADSRVGYVVGHARYDRNAESAADSSEGIYWDLEIKLKQWESAFSSVVGADGAIYAIRRCLYQPLRESDINDFVNPLQIVAGGYRGIFDPEAWCIEKTAGEFGKEYGRKVRIVNRSFNGLLRVPSVCNPLKTGRFAWQVISHKLLRWFSPFFMAGHLVASLFAAGTTPSGVAAAGFALSYLAFALLALAGCRFKNSSGRKYRLFYLPYYFTLMNVAAASGIVKRLNGEVISTWSTVRGNAPAANRPGALVPPLLLSVVIVCCGRFCQLLGLEIFLLHVLAFLVFMLLLYTYVGYPLVAAGLARVCPARSEPDDGYTPEVTLLITAFNEEREIEQKIRNSMELDYPRGLLRIVVASDGSGDRTNDLVLRYADRVELVAFPVNRGKTATLNDAMERINSEIVVFSDANVMYDSRALRKLARHFRDARVGAVSGKVVLRNGAVSYGRAENGYYFIEHFIQKQEGASGAVIGADGAMYAIRRRLFDPPPVDAILDDFVISMNIARRGFLVLHENEAVGYERNLNDIEGEFRRKMRIIAGGVQCLITGQGVPGAGQGLLMFKFISHKVLRWFSGFLSIALLVLLFRIMWLDGTIFFGALLYCFIAAALTALLGQAVPLTRRLLPIGLIHYLFMLKIATITGAYLGFAGRQKVTWRTGDCSGA